MIVLKQDHFRPRYDGIETEASDLAETPGKRASAGDKACLSDQ